MIVQVDVLKEIAETEYPEIITEVVLDLNTLRIILIDESYCDIWFSLKLDNRYSFHWERTFLDGTIYRYDNAPHFRWKQISTFPHHFHNTSEDIVEESFCPLDYIAAFSFFLTFVKCRLNSA